MESPRILIVYGTRYGQAAKIAKHFGDRLTERGCMLDERYANHLTLDWPLSHYDGVVVGASVYMNRHQREVVEFARAYRPYLQGMPTAFYSVSMAAASKSEEGRRQAHAAVERFVDRTGWRPGMTMPLAGALMYRRYGTIERRVMQVVAALAGADTDPSRNYEYTDWEQVRAFAEAYFESLGVDAHPTPVSEERSQESRDRRRFRSGR